MKTFRKFICPACNRLEKEAGIELCQYDAKQQVKVVQVIMLIREKYPSLMTVSSSAILLRFWARHVKNDETAMAAVKRLAAEWRGEGLDKTDDLTPDPEGLF